MKFIDFINFSFLKNKRVKFAVFIGLITFLVSFDLFTKSYVEKTLKLDVPRISDEQLKQYKPSVKWYFEYENKRKDFIPHFWGWRYVRNYDIGFSLFTYFEKFIPVDLKSNILKILQIVVVVAAFIYFLKIQMSYFLPFVLIISGGLGNALGRIHKGYVVDFIEWYLPFMPKGSIFNPWPHFNVADSFAVVGIFTLLYLFIKDGVNEKNRES